MKYDDYMSFEKVTKKQAKNEAKKTRKIRKDRRNEKETFLN